MHPVLLSKLPNEIASLIRDRVPLDNAIIREEVKNEVKKVKNTKLIKPDELEKKFLDFGNNGGWMLNKLNELEAQLYDPKVPPRDFIGSWRSIEFELIFNDDKSLSEFKKLVRGKNIRDRITIQKDGSLRKNEGDDYGIPHEVVFSYKTGEEELVKRFCSFLQDRAYVNKTCGTHVHFDMRHMTSRRNVEILGNRIARWVPVLRKILPQSRRVSKYCDNPINTFESTDRYAFVNLAAFEKYRTIEVRGHSGTVNPTKILNWIAILEKIMSSKVRITKPSLSLNDLIITFKLDDELKKWVEERHAFLNERNEEEAG